MRKQVTIIVCKVRGTLSFHFTDGPLQHMNDECGPRELWFPVTNGKLRASVELIMILNRVATNVTSIEEVMDGTTYKDCVVEYNAI